MSYPVTTVFHIQSLWEKRIGITYVLLVGFCITYGTTVISLGFVANDFQGKPYLPADCGPFQASLAES